MFYDNLTRDKYGFIKLDGYVDVNPDKLKISHINMGGESFYFKPKFISAFNFRLDPVLANGSETHINEIVNEKVIEQFGFGTVDYHLAKVGRQYGLISTSMYSKYPGSELFSNKITDNLKKIPYSLGLASKMRDKKIISDFTYSEFEKLFLLSLGLGQTDAHAGNLGVADDGKLIWFDYERNELRFRTLQELKQKLKDGTLSSTCIGLQADNETLADVYKILQSSNVIDNIVFKNYLNKMNNLLTGNAIFKHINESIEDEYNLSVPKDYMDKLKTLMTVTTSKLEDVYENRAME